MLNGVTGYNFSFIYSPEKGEGKGRVGNYCMLNGVTGYNFSFIYSPEKGEKVFNVF